MGSTKKNLPSFLFIKGPIREQRALTWFGFALFSDTFSVSQLLNCYTFLATKLTHAYNLHLIVSRRLQLCTRAEWKFLILLVVVNGLEMSNFTFLFFSSDLSTDQLSESSKTLVLHSMKKKVGRQGEGPGLCSCCGFQSLSPKAVYVFPEWLTQKERYHRHQKSFPG